MKGDRLRLQNILQAVSALDRHYVADRAAFDADELLRHFAWKQIEIIGEAASKLTPELRAAYPSVPWSRIVGMRNPLVHDYAGVDWSIVWDVWQNHIEPLRLQIEQIIADQKTRVE